MWGVRGLREGRREGALCVGCRRGGGALCVGYRRGGGALCGGYGGYGREGGRELCV